MATTPASSPLRDVNIIGVGGSSINGIGQPYVYTPLGCQQITALNAAAGFASVPAGATLATITVEGQSVRYRDDGTNPTASVGVLLPVGGPWPYSGSLAAIKFIQTVASATINVAFYK